MHSVLRLLAKLPLWAAVVMALPMQAAALDFSADYGLTTPVPAMTLSPAVVVDARYSGAGLSVAAGRNWFAQVSVGRSLQPSMTLTSVNGNDAMSVEGGYRWSDGQALSLQVTSGRGVDRLGLSVRYDWPRYFVRLSYDSKLDLVPQDSVRFQAGMRF
ncbi:MAG: hypothetical protein ACAH21_03200 [Ramlibacter sp.]|nr:hypothetical protein [Ramlibacter sp.]